MQSYMEKSRDSRKRNSDLTVISGQYVSWHDVDDRFKSEILGLVLVAMLAVPEVRWGYLQIDVINGGRNDSRKIYENDDMHLTKLSSCSAAHHKYLVTYRGMLLYRLLAKLLLFGLAVMLILENSLASLSVCIFGCRALTIYV